MVYPPHLRKPYKAEAPYRTINRIRSILESCDIFTKDAQRHHPGVDLYTSRVTIDDPVLDPLAIGQNGKGITSRYSLASAYAELLERLQTYVVFHRKSFALRRRIESNSAPSAFEKRLLDSDLLLDFLWDPSEKYLQPEEMADEASVMLRALFPGKSRNEIDDLIRMLVGLEEIVCVPFFDVRRRRLSLLPQDLICIMASTTNGICAGNTREEALVHGLCEVMERYATARIYEDAITPPEVPLELFKGTQIWERLEYLRRDCGILSVVKDCSMGEGLPVIGLLLVDQSRSRYTFRIGADPCPAIALERCLTEIYQGDPSIKYTNFDHLARREQSDGLPDIRFRLNYYMTIRSGTGLWPENIFDRIPSYPFCGFLHNNAMTDREDLCWLVQMLLDRGRELFVRDVSYLGFPVLHVYVPGMSDIHKLYGIENLSKWSQVDRSVPILLRLKSSTEDEIRPLVEALEYCCNAILPREFYEQNIFLPNTDPDLRFLDIDFLMALLNLRLREDWKAVAHINRYLTRCASENRDDYIYYFAVRDYLTLGLKGIALDGVRDQLTLWYGPSMATEVCEDLADRSAILQHHRLPNCFDCDKCEVSTTCVYLSMVAHLRSLQKQHSVRSIDQMALNDVLCWGK
jgi:ribosomal protein S12 methylthiotransferase accessory factor